MSDLDKLKKYYKKYYNSYDMNEYFDIVKNEYKLSYDDKYEFFIYMLELYNYSKMQLVYHTLKYILYFYTVDEIYKIISTEDFIENHRDSLIKFAYAYILDIYTYISYISFKDDNLNIKDNRIIFLNNLINLIYNKNCVLSLIDLLISDFDGAFNSLLCVTYTCAINHSIVDLKEKIILFFNNMHSISLNGKKRYFIKFKYCLSKENNTKYLKEFFDSFTYDDYAKLDFKEEEIYFLNQNIKTKFKENFEGLSFIDKYNAYNEKYSYIFNLILDEIREIIQNRVHNRWNDLSDIFINLSLYYYISNNNIKKNYKQYIDSYAYLLLKHFNINEIILNNNSFKRSYLGLILKFYNLNEEYYANFKSDSLVRTVLDNCFNLSENYVITNINLMNEIMKDYYSEKYEKVYAYRKLKGDLND